MAAVLGAAHRVSRDEERNAGRKHDHVGIAARWRSGVIEPEDAAELAEAQFRGFTAAHSLPVKRVGEHSVRRNAASKNEGESKTQENRMSNMEDDRITEARMADPIEEAVREAARGVSELREELGRERALVAELTSEVNHLQVRCETLQQELEDHKRERAYYQTAAATMAAGLENVGMIWADLVHKANAAARRQLSETDRYKLEIPEIQIPTFLRNGPDSHNEAA